MKIDIEVLELPGSTIKDVRKYYVELLPDRFIYCHDYNAHFPSNEEEELPEENIRITDKSTYKKEMLIGASLNSQRLSGEAEDGSEDYTIYIVQIPIAQIGDVVELMFSSIKKANDFHKTITDYIFS